MVRYLSDKIQLLNALQMLKVPNYFQIHLAVNFIFTRQRQGMFYPW